MLLLVAKSESQLPAHPRVGTLVTPSNGAIPGTRPWAMDNEAYSGFQAEAFLSMLYRLKGTEGCLFVALPDVVGNHRATARFWDAWVARVETFGFPLAWVAQDGARPADVPYKAQAVFLGGSTEWKLGDQARAIVRYALAQGLWVHGGRVNSRRRARQMASWGVQSIDGSSMARFTDQRLPFLLEGTEHRQMALD